MAVRVPAHRDHRRTRPQRVEPRAGGPTRRPVVPHLQNLNLRCEREQFLFHRQASVPHKECVEAAIANMQDDGVLVWLKLVLQPIRSRMQHGNREVAKRDRISGPGRPPGEAPGIHQREILQVERGAKCLPRLEHELGVDVLEHRRDPAQMVGIAMRDHDDVEFPHAAPAQERQDHSCAGVEPGRPGTTIYQ